MNTLREKALEERMTERERNGVLNMRLMTRKIFALFTILVLLVAAMPVAVAPVFAAETPQHTIIRIQGPDRFQTSIKAANAYRKEKGVAKFDSIIVASGMNFADALSGSYLAAVAEAPILLVSHNKTVDATAYINRYLAKKGTLYILGGKGAIPESFDLQFEGRNVVRLAGKDRFETNLAILEEGDRVFAEKHNGLRDRNLVVCSGRNYPDSMVAGATGYPIMLIGSALTEEQMSYVEKRKGDRFYVVGGKGVVPEYAEAQVSIYGKVKRAAGQDRYETAVKTAQMFFGYYPKEVVVAYGDNFADGLSAAPLAQAKKCPILLSNSKNIAQSYNYEENARIQRATVMGGKTLVAAKNIYVPKQYFRTGLQKYGSMYVYVKGDGQIETSPFTYKGLKVTPSKGGLIPPAALIPPPPPKDPDSEYTKYGTAIVININEQVLKYVRRGKVVLSTDIVSGNVAKGWSTPKGTYRVVSKMTNVTMTGEDYVDTAKMWLGFIGNSYGIHDSSWRRYFGGTIYKNGGSHGCVNVPYSKMVTLYNTVGYGTKVVIK